MTSTETSPAASSSPPAGRRQWWPLLIALTGLVGLAALFAETRPDNDRDFDYPITVSHIPEVDPTAYRISMVVGYLFVLLLILCAVVWRQRVERRFPGSAGAVAVGYGVLTTAALSAFAYGWRGAMGLYLPGGPEENTYDADGLYAYFILNDFGPYIAAVPLLAAGYGLAWMAFRERLVSRGLGGVAAGGATLLLAAAFAMGVPGLPVGMLVGLVVAGIWLAVGRSPITAS